MRPWLAVWVLIGNSLPSFAKTVACLKYTGPLNATVKAAKYDDFLQHFEPKQTYTYLQKLRPDDEYGCVTANAEKKCNLRFNWSKEEGFLKIQFSDWCMVIVFRKNSSGFLECNEQPFKKKRQQKLGFYIDQKTSQRVLYLNLALGNHSLFYEYWPIETDPELVIDGNSLDCNSTAIDGKLFPSSKGMERNAKDSAETIVLCCIVVAFIAIAFVGFKFSFRCVTRREQKK